MKVSRYIIFTVFTAVILILLNSSFSHALLKPKLKKKSTAKSISLINAGKPDLKIAPLQWSKPPKQGDVVGKSSLLNMTIVNQGKAASQNCKIKITCTSLSQGSSPSSMNGILNLSSLKPGKSISLSWPPLSSEIWPAGKFRIGVHIDYQNSVNETNETNNVWRLTFTVQPKFKAALRPKAKIKKVKSQMAGSLSMVDFDILSIGPDTENPHDKEYVNIIVKIKNKKNIKSKIPFYVKCKPLDGGKIYPMGKPGEELVRNIFNIDFEANETREVEMFYSRPIFTKGRYFLAAAKDKDFKQSLVSMVMTVQAREDVPVKISKLWIENAEIPSSSLPFNLLAGPQSKKITIEGGGFSEQSEIYYQNMTTGGNIWTVEDSRFSYGGLYGSLPVSASNVTGLYRLWVQSPNGDKTFKYQFNIVESGTAPQIYEWSPKTITDWNFTRQYYDQRFYVKVGFRGKNIFKSTTDFWIESNTVSDHLNAHMSAINGSCSIKFHIFKKDLPFKEGEIKLWIYNKHRDPSIDTKHNAQWFIIKVRNGAATIINPPTILKPNNKATFTLENIKIVLKEQTGYGVSGYEVEWKTKVGNFLLPVSIIGYINRDTESTTTSTTISANKFENNGVYFFRVRVKGMFQVFINEDRQWSDWREFKVIRRP